MQRTQTNDYVWQQVNPRRTSGTFIVNDRASQIIIVRPCLSSRYATKNHNSYTWNSWWASRRRRRPRKSLRDNIKQRTVQSLSSLLRSADDRSRWATITAEAAVGVGLFQLRIGVMGVSLSAITATAEFSSIVNSNNSPQNSTSRKRSIVSGTKDSGES